MFVPSNSQFSRVALAALFLAALPAPARAASSFIVKVSLNTAMNGNVTPGDLPGFPITISRAGTYELVGNLDVRKLPNPWNVTAIQVLTDDVTIEMNGFEIRGPAVCTSAPVTCANTGTGDGVTSTNHNVIVRNGTIRGMGDDGIALDSNSTIANVKAIGNGGDGITVQDASTVEYCTVQYNGDDGMQVGNTSIVRGNIAKENREQGIVAGNASTVSGNSLFRNGFQGILTSGACTVTGNTAVNHASNFGFTLGAGSGYGGNVLTDNNGPVGNNNSQVSGGGIEIAPNVCGTDTLCP